MQLPGAVGGQHHHGRLLGRHGADLGDRHGRVGEHLEQEGLELLVGAVQLVHQQHRAGPRAHRAQQRPLHQELRPVELGGAAGRVELAVLDGPGVEELARVVPLVEGLAGVDSLVALEPDELGVEHARQGPRDLGLPHAGLALQQQRPAEREGQEDRDGEAAIGEVRLLREGRLEGVDVLEPHPSILPAGMGRFRSSCVY